VRESRTAVLTVSAVLVVLALIVAGVLYLPTLLFLPSRHQSDKSESAARQLIDHRMDTYATQVVAESTSSAGPTPVELAELGEQASVQYAAERPGGALTALWVVATDGVGGLFGPYHVIECYTIAFHDLGTPGAGARITLLPDCTAVNARLKAQPPTPRPTGT
jgi:hypothetical protein